MITFTLNLRGDGFYFGYLLAYKSVPRHDFGLK